MKLTKFQHACLQIDYDGATIIVDPGVFSRDVIIPKQLDAIIITHDHPDHCDPQLIGRLLAKHPAAVIMAVASITSQFTQYPTLAVETGGQHTVKTLSLKFTGGEHAVIVPGQAVVPNLGVIINDSLYYPGDSFSLPDQPIMQLALPVSAPWAKISETLQFLDAVAPRFVFPTHDAILSDDGKTIIDTWVEPASHQLGAVYQRLDGNSVTF